VSRPTRPFAYNGIKAPQSARMIDRRKFVALLSAVPFYVSGLPEAGGQGAS
jgi:hypothetical protein